MLPFEGIMLLCCGDNYNIVIEFYDLMNKLTQELVVEEIKNNLHDGYCDDIVFECLSFVRYLKDFMFLDYDVLKSFKRNRDSIGRKIGAENFDYFLEVTGGQI